MDISVAARLSPLSQAQLLEVCEELKSLCPEVQFKPTFLQAYGDKDLTISLRDMGKTDFFTKEIDECVLFGHCRIAIHSAKDLPEELPAGLKVVAITKGLSPNDALVLQEALSLDTLPQNAVIAASSLKREQVIKALWPDAHVVDIRGTIEKRLQKLIEGQVHGVVIAEAALIRLKLTHLNYLKLPGETTPLQGRLAIVCRSEDVEMETLFAPLDARTPF